MSPDPVGSLVAHGSWVCLRRDLVVAPRPPVPGVPFVVAAGAMVALGRLPLADILLAAIAASALGHGDGSRSGADRAIDDRCSPAVVADA